MRATPPRLLTIAGSDSGGGAGIQADLKTFAAHGAYGLSVITALTAQNTREVRAVAAAEPEMVAAQLAAVLEDIGADAIKIGMLANAGIVRAVAGVLDRYLREAPGTPVVLDPVMVAKSGAALLADDAVAALVHDLLPLATVVTPNLPELARLAAALAPDAGDPGHSGKTGLVAEESRKRAALALVAEGSGPAVLAKGGHAPGDPVVDLLVLADSTVHRFEHPRLPGLARHGTGCTLSSAIAARLGGRAALPEAVAGALNYLAGAIAAAYPVGSGHGPVDHLYRLFPRPVSR